MSALPEVITKIIHLSSLIKNNLFKRKLLLRTAHKLTNLSRKAFDLGKYSERKDLLVYHLFEFLSDVLGIYISSSSYHDSVQTLYIAGHCLNAMALVRPQIESLLIFCYFTEPYDDLNKIKKRVTEYNDWLQIRMKKNVDMSSEFTKKIKNSKKFFDQVKANYDLIKRKYGGKEKELIKLERSMSFLKNKSKLAEKHGFKDLYNHVQAECSASLHLADMSDRISEKNTNTFTGYQYRIHQDSEWPMFLSNYTQTILLLHFTRFFRLEKIFPLLQKIYE